MQILRITVKNLNSLRLTRTIDFTCPPLSHAGIFAITGDTGAGKSTLLDAITLALYGQVPRREKEDLGATMSYGATDCLAEVEFAQAGSTYRAKWSLRRAHGRATGNILGPSRELAKQNPETGAFDIIGQAEREVSNQILELTGLTSAGSESPSCSPRANSPLSSMRMPASGANSWNASPAPKSIPPSPGPPTCATERKPTD